MVDFHHEPFSGAITSTKTRPTTKLKMFMYKSSNECARHCPLWTIAPALVLHLSFEENNAEGVRAVKVAVVGFRLYAGSIF